jgi:hypothetical protein
MINSWESLEIPPDDFVRPPGISEGEVCWPSGRLVTEYCPDWRREKSLYATEVLERIQRSEPTVNESVVLTPTPVPIFVEEEEKISLEDSDTVQSEFVPATDGWDIGLNYESGYDDWWKLVLIDQRTNEIARALTPKQFINLSFDWCCHGTRSGSGRRFFEWARLQGIQELIPPISPASRYLKPLTCRCLYHIREQISSCQAYREIRLNNTVPLTFSVYQVKK